MVKKSPIIALLFITFVSPVAVHAQTWIGIINSSRAANWAFAGVEGGIPSGYTNCVTSACNTLFGGSVTSATIQSAINSAPANTVVRIPVGTFNLSAGFRVNNNFVVVRGAGASLTLLNINGGAASNCGYFYTAAIEICAVSSIPQNSANWTSGYSTGTTRIFLSSVTGISVGTVVFLDQLSDTTDGYPATGDLFLCESSSNNCSSQGGGTSSLGGAGRAGRATTQAVRITAINAGGCGSTCLDITPPISMPNFRSGQSPGAYWTSNVGNIISYAGVENLSVDYTGIGGSNTVGVEISNAVNVWLKGVRIVYTGSSLNFSLQMTNTLFGTIRDNYIANTSTPIVASYPMEAINIGSMLIENNICHGVHCDLVTDGPYTNSVFSYNFTVGTQGPSFIRHGAAELMNLMEGNLGGGLYSDVIHGTSAFTTYYRNAMLGNKYNSGSCTICNPIHIEANNRFYNIVGNVLGGPAFSRYETQDTGNGGYDSGAIFNNGWGGNASGVNITADPRVHATMMRWGNWDSVTNAARFCGDSSDTGWVTTCSSITEVPSGLTNFPNAKPTVGDTVAGQGPLPASFYYSAKPTWWPPAKPWPAIGPDVTGGNITNTNGHAYTNPAADCYLTVMGGPINGSGGPLSFDATACYSIASIPSHKVSHRMGGGRTAK